MLSLPATTTATITTTTMDDTQASSTIQTTQAAGGDNAAVSTATDAVYTLHYFTFSLYSLMARFGLALGRQLNPETAPRITLQFVNTADDDNLSEHYLTQVNPRGQVRIDNRKKR